MARKKSWAEKATAQAIRTKMTRKKNPVTSYAQLANEFGAPVSPGTPSYSYASAWGGLSYSGSGPAASSSFRNHVKRELGVSTVEFAKA